MIMTNSQEIIKVSIQELKECNASQLGILHSLMSRDLIHDQLYPSQTRLGRTAGGYVRETVNRGVKKLCELGLIKKKRRYNQTCLYEVNRSLYRPHTRRAFSKYLPILGSLTVLLLLSYAEKSGNKGNVTSSSGIDNLYNKQYHSGSKESTFYQRIRSCFIKNSRREMVMSNITPTNKRICSDLGATDYGALLLSAFPDNVLEKAYQSYKLHKKDVKSPIPWMFKRSKTLCEECDIEPDYNKMLKAVHAAGYKSGDRMSLASDPEAHPRFNDPKPQPIKKSNGVRSFEQKTPEEEKEILRQFQNSTQDHWMKRFIQTLDRSKPEYIDERNKLL